MHIPIERHYYQTLNFKTNNCINFSINQMYNNYLYLLLHMLFRSMHLQNTFLADSTSKIKILCKQFKNLYKKS